MAEKIRKLTSLAIAFMVACLVVAGFPQFDVVTPPVVLASPGVETLRPNAVGATNAWDPSGATNNWECVDEVPPYDDDGTYAYTTKNNKRDSYNLQDHTTGSGTISNVRVYARARTLPPAKTLAIEIVVGGITYTGAIQTMTTSYVDYLEDWGQNPNTIAAWTWADIDALEAGFANFVAGGIEHRVTAVWVEVTYTAAAAERSVSQGITVSDVVTTTVGRGRDVSQGIIMSDVVTTTVGRGRDVSQGITIADGVTAAVARGRNVSQGITIADGVTAAVAKGRNVSQTLSLSATTSAAASFNRPVSQGITISDGVTAAAGGDSHVSQGITVSDGVTAIGGR